MGASPADPRGPGGRRGLLMLWQINYTVSVWEVRE